MRYLIHHQKLMMTIMLQMDSEVECNISLWLTLNDKWSLSYHFFW
ncbi:hypothetical protein PSHT_12650 [Puccinia striiformis]|uniref:Uncharacterized protein n=1 Tax=Puccinia striiformis TaxID=27350 RepID=A0A2S4U9Z0_9BASI|nr:hypothetical protein PSHT_16444 [Puccinia striiformis]POW01197.1 hypothetical protein PSHT_12650 [Puccinia striiformis]